MIEIPTAHYFVSDAIAHEADATLDPECDSGRKLQKVFLAHRGGLQNSENSKRPFPSHPPRGNSRLDYGVLAVIYTRAIGLGAAPGACIACERRGALVRRLCR